MKKVTAVSEKNSKRHPASPPGGRASERREQQRSVDTRNAILDAALAEFAEKGFDAASTRSIAQRAAIHNTLLNYHYDNKDALWRATVEHFFGDMAERLVRTISPDPNLMPIEKIREEFRSFFYFISEHPEFHRLILREAWSNSPRLPWLIERFVVPIMNRVVPLIERAQHSGNLPACQPILIYYFLVSVSAGLSAHSAEIKFLGGGEPSALPTAESYWSLVDRIVFAKTW